MILGNRHFWLFSLALTFLFQWFLPAQLLFLGVCNAKIEMITLPYLTGWRREVVARISYLRAMACQMLLIMQSKKCSEKEMKFLLFPSKERFTRTLSRP